MRILVAEDEHRIANTIKRGLEQDSYAVDVVYDGNAAYDMTTTEEYDMMIFDIMMPGLDGIALCKKIRADRKHTPILLLTAKDQVRDKVLGLDAGADDYLAKPFAFEELLARIRALLRRTPTLPMTTLQVGDLTIDTGEYMAHRAGVGIALSKKEFTLLEYLMKHAGQVLSRDQIIAHVWDYDADILPNTVEVYIRNLRHKIDVPFTDQKALIQTVRGFGYKITN